MFPKGDELLARLADAELVLPAGERWHYSNLAYALLGEVVARVAGTAFADFVDERLIGRSDSPGRPGSRSSPQPAATTSTPMRGRSARSRPSKATVPRRSAASGARRRISAAGRTTSPRSRRCTRCRSWTTRKDGRSGTGWDSSSPAAATACSSGTAARCPASSRCCSAAVRKGSVRRSSRTPRRLRRLSRRSRWSWRRRRSSSTRPSVEVWRPEAEPPPEVAELLGIWWAEGTPFTFWWEGGRLHARPTESDKPRARVDLRSRGAGHVPGGRGPGARGAAPRRPRSRRRYREALLGDLPRHPRALDVRVALLTVRPPCRRSPPPRRSRRSGPSRASCSNGRAPASMPRGSPRRPSLRSPPGGTRTTAD